MQTLTETVVKLAPPGSLFDDTVVRNLFPGASSGARKLLANRALKHGEVLRLKRGLYCLAPDYRRTQPHPFIVAAALHSPSHVSLETALAYHGLIPEAVMQVSSVTIARSRVFNTPLGTFTFQRVPCRAPRAGVRAVKVDVDAWAFVAVPLRAIADLVYLRNDVDWERDGLNFLTESMRMERADLRNLSLNDYREIHDALQNQRTRQYLAGLRKELRPC